MSPIGSTSGPLFHNWQDADGGQGNWHAWVPNFQGAKTMRFVTAVSGPGPNNFYLHVFGIGANGTLFHNWEDSYGAWHAWQRDYQGAPKLDLIAAAIGTTGHLEVFAIGTDGTLFHNWQEAEGESWHQWLPNFQSAPKMRYVDAAIGTTGHLEVFAIGTDGTLYHNWQDDQDGGRWYDWVPSFQGAPKVAGVNATLHQNLEVFAIATDGTLLHNWQDDQDGGQWHGWVPDFQGARKMRPAAGAGALAAAVGSGPYLQVFAIGADGTLYQNWQDGQDGGRWHDWAEDFLGAPKVVFVMVAQGPNAELELFAIGTDGTLLRTWQDPRVLTDPYRGWHPWERHFQSAPPSRFVTAALGGGTGFGEGPHLEAFLVSR